MAQENPKNCKLLDGNIQLSRCLQSIYSKIEHLQEVESRLIGYTTVVELPQEEGEGEGKGSIKDITRENVGKAEAIDEALADILNELDSETLERNRSS